MSPMPQWVLLEVLSSHTTLSSCRSASLLHRIIVLSFADTMAQITPLHCSVRRQTVWLGLPRHTGPASVAQIGGVDGDQPSAQTRGPWTNGPCRRHRVGQTDIRRCVQPCTVPLMHLRGLWFGSGHGQSGGTHGDGIRLQCPGRHRPTGLCCCCCCCRTAMQPVMPCCLSRHAVCHTPLSGVILPTPNPCMLWVCRTHS